MLRTMTIFGLVSLATALVTACDKPCEPALTLALADTVEVGRALTVRYALPVDGSDDDDKATFRIETPCACVVVERTFAAPANTSEAFGGDASCTVASVAELPVVVPKGGDCRFSVTVSFRGDTRTLVREPRADACQQLECTSDVACSAGLPAPGDEGGAASEGGAAATGGAGGTGQAGAGGAGSSAGTAGGGGSGGGGT